MKTFHINSNIFYNTKSQKKTKEVTEINIKSILTIKIYQQNLIIYGNNQQILLEQLERAGINTPYYCRMGICGFCQVKLVNGEVNALKKSAISEDGAILCCSCIPQTSITLNLYNNLS